MSYSGSTVTTSGGLTTVNKVLIALAVVLFVAMVAFLVIGMLKKKKKSTETENEKTEEQKKADEIEQITKNQETLNKNILTVDEKVKQTNEKIEQADQKIEKINEENSTKIGELDNSNKELSTEVNTKIDNLQKTVDELNSRLSEVTTEVKTVKEDLQGVKMTSEERYLEANESEKNRLTEENDRDYQQVMHEACNSMYEMACCLDEKIFEQMKEYAKELSNNQLNVARRFEIYDKLIPCVLDGFEKYANNNKDDLSSKFTAAATKAIEDLNNPSATSEQKQTAVADAMVNVPPVKDIYTFFTKITGLNENPKLKSDIVYSIIEGISGNLRMSFLKGGVDFSQRLRALYGTELRSCVKWKVQQDVQEELQQQNLGSGLGGVSPFSPTSNLGNGFGGSPFSAQPGFGNGLYNHGLGGFSPAYNLGNSYQGGGYGYGPI